MILKSVKHGPLIWPTIEENGVTRTKKYEKKSAIEKIQADYDLKATNIILQGNVTWQDNAQSQRGKGMLHGLGIKFFWLKHKDLPRQFMANLFSYGSDVLSEVNKDNLIANESLSAELERYKERVKLLEERQYADLSTQEKLIMDDIIREKNAQFADFEEEINYLKQILSEQS
nr:hypothetical protein [Tanacetum cinerariifolium]